MDQAGSFFISLRAVRSTPPDPGNEDSHEADEKDEFPDLMNTLKGRNSPPYS
jgi:hypothetical protein